MSDTDRRFEAYRASSVATSADLGEVNPFPRYAAPAYVWDDEDPDYEWTGDVYASAWELRNLYEHHAEVRKYVRKHNAQLRATTGIAPAWLRQIDLGELPPDIRYNRGEARDAYQMPVRATRHSGTSKPQEKKDSDKGDVARLIRLSAARRAPYERALDGAPSWLTFDLVLAAEGGTSYVQLAKHAGISDVTVAKHLGDAMGRLEDTGPMLREGHERVKTWLLNDISKAPHDDRVTLRSLLDAPLLWFGDRATHAKMTAPTPLADAQRRQREADAEKKRQARVAKARADADAVRALDAARRITPAERLEWLAKMPGRNETTLTESDRAKMDGKTIREATSALAIEWKAEQRAEAKKWREEAKARKNVANVEKPFENATPTQSIEWRGNVSPASPLSFTPDFGTKPQSAHRESNMQYLKYADVAARAGVTTRTIETQVSRGKLRCLKIGRTVLFEPAEVDAWLNSCRVA